MTEQQPYPTREQIVEALYQANGSRWTSDVNGVPNTTKLAEAVLALFSQPTPSADPTCTCGHIMDDHDLSETGECQVAIPWCPCMTAKDATEPVSIADVAPGTTFWKGGDVWTVRPGGVVEDDLGQVWSSSRIDPSTIRDVTPPLA